MKVILKQDVAKIGRRFEVVDVPDGYAFNKLIPQGQAEPATAAAVKRLQQHKSVAAATDASTAADLAAAVAELKKTPLHVAVNANDQGHLFRAVTAADIVTAAAKQGITLSEAAVQIDAPIKSVGEHTVTLKHGADVTDITITIVSA